ncbi:hypothetical protein F4802DRAFT_545600 [Xylaria palmicola]|nr:hypothetical protein F4802DRAFT_545600 [Xylaria palmicola]
MTWKQRRKKPCLKLVAPTEETHLAVSLICKTLVTSRSTLTRHFNSSHSDETPFSQPFYCPECQLVGLKEMLISNARR